MVHVRIDGSDAGRAAAKIDAAIARLPGEASRVVRGHGLQMEAEAKQNIVAMGAVDTGYMLGSVGIIEQSALSVTVAVGAEEYPVYVEYGTSKMSGNIVREALWKVTVWGAQERRDKVRQWRAARKER